MIFTVHKLLVSSLNDLLLIASCSWQTVAILYQAETFEEHRRFLLEFSHPVYAKRTSGSLLTSTDGFNYLP